MLGGETDARVDAKSKRERPTIDTDMRKEEKEHNERVEMNALYLVLACSLN